MKNLILTFVDDNKSDCPLYMFRPNGLPPLAFLNIPLMNAPAIEIRATSLLSCNPQLTSEATAKVYVPGDISRRALMQLQIPNSAPARLISNLIDAHSDGNPFRFNNILKSLNSYWNSAERAHPIEISDFWNGVVEKFSGEVRFFLPRAKGPRVLKCGISDSGLCILAELLESTEIWRNRTSLVLGDTYEFLTQLRDELQIDAEIGRDELVVGRASKCRIVHQ